MKELLRAYQKTIEDIEQHITTLKTALENERKIEEIHSLERRIELLSIERSELIQTVAEIKEYIAPKPVHPSLLYKAASGEG